GRADRAAGAPAPQLLQEGFVEPQDTVFFPFPLADGELAAEPVNIVDGQRQRLGGAQAGMQHELHQTAIAVAGQVTWISAGQEGGNLRTGEHRGQTARTGHGRGPFSWRRRYDTK